MIWWVLIGMLALLGIASGRYDKQYVRGADGVWREQKRDWLGRWRDTGQKAP